MGSLTNSFATTVETEFDEQKIATINGGLQVLDDAIGGKLDIATTGGTTTLTGTPAAPQAQHMFLNVTGVLGSAATIEIPVAAGTGRNRVYVVKNGTSGAFGLTVKKVGGTGVKVSQGTVNFVYYDGSDIATLTAPPSTIWARAYHSTTQSMSNTTVTALSLDSERFDTDTIHDTVTNNSRLTCRTAGVYVIAGHFGFAGNATGSRAGYIRLNGATDIASQWVLSAGATPNTRLNLTTMYSLAALDYVQLMAYQDSGGALLTEQAANYSPEFSMVRIGS